MSLITDPWDAEIERAESQLDEARAEIADWKERWRAERDGKHAIDEQLAMAYRQIDVMRAVCEAAEHYQSHPSEPWQEKHARSKSLNAAIYEWRKLQNREPEDSGKVQK